MPQNKQYYHPQSDFFRKFNIPAPETIAHGVDEDIAKKFSKLETTNWRMEGNKLIADTPMGPLVNTISTDYICRGTDKQGLPILEKIGE